MTRMHRVVWTGMFTCASGQITRWSMWRQDGRIGDVVYLQVHPDVLGKEGVLFTGAVSNKSGVETIPLSDALDMIDFKVLHTRTDWSDPEVQQRLRQAEKYELLVPDHIELKLIRNLPNG